MSRTPAAKFRRLLLVASVASVVSLTLSLLAASLTGLSPSAWATEYTVETVPNVKLADKNAYVSDPDGILPMEDVAAINAAAGDLEKNYGVELAVVALKNIRGEEARSFATELFNHWGLGKKGKDNGLLILLVTEPPHRSVTFETGYGLEGVLPDAIAFRLQQRYMVPDLAQAQYGSGMRQGVDAVKAYLEASDLERVTMLGEVTDASPDEEDPLLPLFLIFALFFLFPIVAETLRRRPRQCPNCGHKTFRYVGSETLRQPTFAQPGTARETYRCSHCGYTETRNRRLPRLRKGAAMGGSMGGMLGGMGGFGGHSGGMGGGGSWGGGRSGGGGASSRF